MSGETLKTVIQRHVSAVSVTLAASFESQNDIEDRSTPGSYLVLEKSFQLFKNSTKVKATV